MMAQQPWPGERGMSAPSPFAFDGQAHKLGSQKYVRAQRIVMDENGG